MSYVLSGQPNNGRPFSDYGKRPKISIYRVPIIPSDRLGIILHPICVMAQSIFPLFDMVGGRKTILKESGKSR